MCGLRHAAVVLSGNELLDGRIRDANGTLVCDDLSARGVKVTSCMTVADDKELLTTALRSALASRPDLLIVGGGLGTTHDDLTAECLAVVLGVELEEDAVALAMLEDSLRAVAERRQTTVRELMPQARRQAFLPRGMEPLPPAGVAPGMSGVCEGTRIYAFPGVPAEFRAMWSHVVEGLVRDDFFPAVRTRVLRIVGSGEPPVAAALATVPHDLLETGITIGGGEVTVKLRYPHAPKALRQAETVVAALKEAVTVYSSDGRTVDEVVADWLIGRGESVAVAESCTGGLLGGRITSRNGSSTYFQGGVISYANEVKTALLGVSPADLDVHGAVSAEVAAQMSAGVRSVCRSTYGMSVTGVAGPGGGTPDKPVGLVFIGCSGPNGTRVVREQFHGDRDSVRALSVTRALHLLREYIGEQERT